MRCGFVSWARSRPGTALLHRDPQRVCLRNFVLRVWRYQLELALGRALSCMHLNDGKLKCWCIFITGVIKHVFKESG